MNHVVNFVNRVVNFVNRVVFFFESSDKSRESCGKFRESCGKFCESWGKFRGGGDGPQVKRVSPFDEIEADVEPIEDIGFLRMCWPCRVPLDIWPPDWRARLGAETQGYLAHKKPPPLGPYSRPVPRAQWWS